MTVPVLCTARKYFDCKAS